VKNQIIPLEPNDPQMTISQEKPNMIHMLQWFVERFIKEALHH
jgi:hypothetical protein